jgi:AcrR family transcriptional regulator
VAQQPPGRRLNRDDWTAAGLAALAEGGVSAVAIEPLAKRLGATKGSAYWHFTNREALLAATLERWEQESTEAIIAWLESKVEPAERLHALADAAMQRDNDLRIELALQAAADLPAVSALLHRVAARRLDYMTSMYEGVGFDAEAARRRAVLTYFIYLGRAQMRRSSPALLPTTDEGNRELMDDALRGLLAR